MTRPIYEILNQLGNAIELQLEAANDRAVSAEREYARLRDGLRALVEKEHDSPIPANDETPKVVESDGETAKSDLVEARSRKRTSIPDQAFLDALTATWQSAHTMRKVIMASWPTVAFGTVYNRMEKLSVAFPDVIEMTTEPVRWRRRSPTLDKERCRSSEAKRNSIRSSHPARGASGMPLTAITNVPERVAAAAVPAKMFVPMLHRSDCFEAMKSITDGSVDLILSDPPYSTTGLDIDPPIDLTALWADYRRIIKPTGTIVIFGSQPFTSRLICEAKDLFKYDLIWIKNRATQSLQARNRPLKQHEDILVFSAGAAIHENQSLRRYTYHPIGQIASGPKKISSGKHSSYLQSVNHNPGRIYVGTTNNPRTTLFCPKDKENLHPFQKPLDLLEYLIRTYSNEGDTVLDTFAGSGGTCVAAARCGRRSIGIEVNEKYFHAARARVEASVARFAEAA